MADPEFRKEIWSTLIKFSGPEELREYAGYFRDASLHDVAVGLEELADERQRGRFGS